MLSKNILSLLLLAEAFAFDSSDIGIAKALRDLPVRKRSELVEKANHVKRKVAELESKTDYYKQNVANPEFMKTQDEIMAAAQGMEGRRKRGLVTGQSAPMDNYFDGNIDILYTVNVSMGTPFQTFNVVPDTGSADLWVISSTVSDPNHDLFNTAASSSINITQYQFSNTYGLGQANGTIVQDTVSMANYTLRNKYFGVATSIDRQFQRQPNDGILGLSSSRISSQGTTTFFEDLVTLNAIQNPYFSVFLSRGRDTRSAAGIIGGSTICIGCISQPGQGQSLTGSLTYVPLTLFAYWEVAMSAISYNGQNIAGTSTNVIIDTGTTAIYLPTTIADAMMARVNGRRQTDGSYYVPLTALNSNPTFAFTFSGNTYTVYLLDLVDGFVDTQRTTLAMTVYAGDTQDPQGNPLGILGDAFIKNVITVYTYSNNGAPAVGFQQLVSNSSVAASGAATVGSSTTRIPGVPTTGTLGRTTSTRSLTQTSSIAASASSTTARSAGSEVVPINFGIVGSALCMVLAVVLGAAIL